MSQTQAWSVHHRRRLREVWRSTGWPCRDPIEVDLLAAGLLERRVDDQGRETLRVSDQGVAILAATLEQNRRVRDPHEVLVTRMALRLHHAGRLVWRGLGLRAPQALMPDVSMPDVSMSDGSAVQNLPVLPKATLDWGSEVPGAMALKRVTATPKRWAMAMPDLYSLRNTSVQAYLEPAIHEIKVRRSDLLADVRRPEKRAAYLALASECWYVLKDGIGSAQDVPDHCGVIIASPTAFDVLRPAPRGAAAALPWSTWLALSKAARCNFGDEDAQGFL